MNAILAGLREFALYGLIWSLLGKNILFAIIAIGLYLLFMLFTWLKAKHFTQSMSDELGVEIPTNNYFIYLLRGLFLDLVAPIRVIINLFRKKEHKILDLIITFIAVIASMLVFVR